jgi:hypothetical protein
MSIPNTLEASNVILPQDLVITAQPNIDTNYFTVTAKGLEVDSSYNFQFQWVYEDGAVGPWSPSVFLITPTESVPGAPSVTVPGTSTGYIPVTLSAFPANALRVDVRISGGDFGVGNTVAYSFLKEGTTAIPAKAGLYYVQLYTVTPTNINGTPTSAFSITVSDNTIPVILPETPDVPVAKAGLASVIVEWNGKKTGGADFATGSFAGAKVFIGTTAGFVPSNDNWVHTLNFANGSNKVSIGVGTVINKTAGTLLAYGTPYYIKIDTINANGVVNNNPIAASGVPVTVSKLPASEISTGTITADNSITAGVNGGQRVVISGSAAPFIIYGTDGTTKLLEYVTSGTTGSLAIKGSGTFTGSLEIGSGNNIFKADPSTGIWLGNSVFGSANFSVSTSGILTALAGSVGGWTITSSSIYSSVNTAVNRMALYPSTPQLSLIIPSSFKIELDPTNGLKFSKISDNAGSTITSVPFQVSPNGNLTATDATITVTAGIDNIVKIGKGVQGSNNGIYINDNNYWYGTGNFKVGGATNNIVWDNSTSSLTIKGKLETTGNVGVYTGNTLTIDGGAISADKVVQLSAGTGVIDGVIYLFTDYFTVSAGETEIFGTIKMSGNTTFYNQTRFNSTDNQIVNDGSVGSGSTGVLRNIYINTTLVGLTSTTGRVGDVWLQYA